MADFGQAVRKICFHKMCWQLFVVLFGVCFLANFGFCEEFVKISLQPEDEQQTLSQIKQEILKKGFAQGVLQVANSLLERPLDDARQQVVAQWLEADVQGFILGYSDFVFRRKPNRIFTAEMNVNVNTPAVKKFLKKNGMLQTCVQPVRYFLSQGMLGAEDLQDLELFYGLKRVFKQKNAEVVLEISPVAKLKNITEDTKTKTEEKEQEVELLPSQKYSFDVKLYAGKKVFHAGPSRLNRAWQKVWKGYFSQPVFALQGTSLATLWLTGWENCAEAYAFDRTLRSWTKVVDSVQLEFLQVAAHRTKGFWTIRSTDAKRFNAKLEQYLAAHSHLQLLPGVPEEEGESF